MILLLTFDFKIYLQVYTEGVDKCYTTEEAAIATCPTRVDITTGQAREIMLYSKFSRIISEINYLDKLLI